MPYGESTHIKLLKSRHYVWVLCCIFWSRQALVCLDLGIHRLRKLYAKLRGESLLVCCPPLSYTPPSPSSVCVELHQDISVDVLMTKENLLFRMLGSCETVANLNASVVCTDKTRTLTQNEMTVVAGSVSVHVKFVRNVDENRPRAGKEETNGPNSRAFAIDMLNLNAALIRITPQLAEPLNALVSVDSTAFEDVDPDSGAPVYIGSKTGTALLKFATSQRSSPRRPAGIGTVYDTVRENRAFKVMDFRGRTATVGHTCITLLHEATPFLSM